MNVESQVYREIVSSAEQIAEHTTWMRYHLDHFTSCMDEIIKTAGVEFAQEGEGWAGEGGAASHFSYRIIAVKVVGWHMMIEEDFSRDADMSVTESRKRGSTRYIDVARASREQLENMILHLPGFLAAFAAELEIYEHRFSDIRKKAKAISMIMEEE